MLLTECMKNAGLNRPLFYITNVVKCRPENNRKPEDFEIKKCSYFLEYELRYIQPYIIVTLGGIATSYFIKNRNMGEIIGKPFRLIKNMIPYTVYPLYHPSYVLRGGITKQEYTNLFLDLRLYIENLLNNIKKRLEVLLNDVKF